MIDYKKVHADKLAEIKKKMLGSNIADKLELKAISNAKIDKIISKMNEVIKPKQVWEDYNFRTGKIFGILRSIAQNTPKRKELLSITGLTQDHIDLYFEVCGNLPYLNTNDGTVNIGRPMMINETKEFITLVALEFGYVIEDSDLFDITQERWTRLYNNALERITETVEHNKQYANDIPKNYDE